MDAAESPIKELRQRILRDGLDPQTVARDALDKSNSNSGRNVKVQGLDNDYRGSTHVLANKQLFHEQDAP